MVRNDTRGASWRLSVALLAVMLAGGAQAVTQKDVEWTANCKAEGEQGKECLQARQNLVKYAGSCKAEGPEGETCVLARKVVETRKFGDQAAPAAAARTAPAAGGAAAKEAGGDKDMQFALHCKVEGADGERCAKMRKQLDEYAANCKEEGADGQRCHDVRAARGVNKGK